MPTCAIGEGSNTNIAAARAESVTSEDFLGLLKGGSAFNLPRIESQAQVVDLLAGSSYDFSHSHQAFVFAAR